MSLPIVTGTSSESPATQPNRLYFLGGSCGSVTIVMGPSPLFGDVHTSPQRSQR